VSCQTHKFFCFFQGSFAWQIHGECPRRFFLEVTAPETHATAGQLFFVVGKTQQPLFDDSMCVTAVTPFDKQQRQ